MYSFVNMLFQHDINVEYAYTYTQFDADKSAFVIRVNEDKMEEALEIIKNCDNVKILKQIK